VFKSVSGFGQSKVESIKVAVAGTTLGVPVGECFGLLGPNGAGKSTTMAMVTADISPTAGDAYLAGHSITNDRQQAFEVMGFCPQADALLDLMTVKEHLEMYARIKGVDSKLLPSLVSHYLDALMLREHRNKYAHKLSGGNKRKLSMAIALIGSPQVVLLDEPSTGLDAQARRGMWNVIKREQRGRAFILTTHSMEEADALCDRIGIMVNGRLRCLGTSQHLKSKFGNGYQIELKTEDDPNEMRKAFNLIRSLVPDPSSVKMLEGFGGKLRLQVPKDPSCPLSRLFSEIEAARAGRSVQDYSIAQTSLEQIFISFARHQQDDNA